MDITRDIRENSKNTDSLSLTERLIKVNRARARMSGAKGRTSSQTATKAKATQDAALQAQLTALIEATPDGVALIDPQGGFRYINPAGRSMLEIGQDETL